MIGGRDRCSEKVISIIFVVSFDVNKWTSAWRTRSVEISCKMSIVSRAALFLASGSLAGGFAVGGIVGVVSEVRCRDRLATRTGTS